MWASMNLPSSRALVNQSTCLSAPGRQKGLTMTEPITSSPSLSAILALAARLERDPRFVVRDVFAHPFPFVEVKDAVHGIVVGFSSEADYRTYCQITARTEGGRHA